MFGRDAIPTIYVQLASRTAKESHPGTIKKDQSFFLLPTQLVTEYEKCRKAMYLVHGSEELEEPGQLFLDEVAKMLGFFDGDIANAVLNFGSPSPYCRGSAQYMRADSQLSEFVYELNENCSKNSLLSELQKFKLLSN